MNRLISLALFSSMGLGAAGCVAATDDVGPSDDVGTSREELRIGGPIILDPIPIRPTRPPVLDPVVDPAPAASQGDLVLDGVMRYYGGGTPTLGLQINVTNLGPGPAVGVTGRVNVAGSLLAASLHPYYDGQPTTANTVAVGKHGYIKVEVPASLMAPCISLAVQIDIDHTMQGGGPNVFANDSGSVSTVCPLTWNTPIDQFSLGHVADPSVNGKTLFNIISSNVSGRPDGVLCSNCHHSTATLPYHPNVPQNGSAPIDPFLPSSGDQTWICAVNPWGPQFVNLPTTVYPHTTFLKEAVQKWISDGAIR